MGNTAQNFKTRNRLQLEEIDGVAVGFAHQRHQNVQRFDQAFACGLGMHHRPLDDALETERGLGFDRV